jgi:hypothetical protein
MPHRFSVIACKLWIEGSVMLPWRCVRLTSGRKPQFRPPDDRIGAKSRNIACIKEMGK